MLKYLARYTHRVAISNGRLLSLEHGQVRFRWRDSRHNNRSSVMRLDAAEFIRRFLLHVLPAGFVKIPPFRITCQPQPTPSAGTLQGPSRNHRHEHKYVADQTANVRTQPLMPTVQMRNPAHRLLFGWTTCENNCPL